MADYRKIRPVRRRAWLESFPDTVYDLKDTSHIVRMLDALCGDPGVSGARKRLMLKRMQTQLSMTQMGDLDALYANTFGLPRLKREVYSYSADDLLSQEQIAEIHVKDAMYRGRIYKYMTAFQYGGTEEGVRLAAEAACGEPCLLVDGNRCSATMCNTDDETYDYPSWPGRHEGVQDQGEAIVIVMQDEPVSTEISHMIYRAIDKLKPQDVVVTVRSRAEVFGALGMEDVRDEEVPISALAASSSWWTTMRAITGRLDWEYTKYPHLWVEPGVRKEAPMQVLVNSQETSDEFTFLIKSIDASSEHRGYYNQIQQKLFSGLATKEAREYMPVSNILSQSASMRYTASFYGGDPAINWSYPIQYSPEILPFFKEEGRYVRRWSSDEAKAGGEPEWVELELKRSIPINRLSLDVSRKPLRITPYVSSGFDKDGNRVWARVLGYGKGGIELAHVMKTWGGTLLTGEMCTVEFKFKTVVADAIRLEFERLDTPLVGTNPDGTVEEQRFAYSVEGANLSIWYDVASKDDFIAASFEDPFGNLAETSLVEFTPERMFDKESMTYWISQPNIAENAVEYLLIDVRDANGDPVMVNELEIDAVYGGCQMNVYSDFKLDEDGQPVEWTPYPESYELNSGRFVLPSRRVSFLKLEFTRLAAIPYTVTLSGITVESRLFPEDLRRRFDSKPRSTYELGFGMEYIVAPEGQTYGTNSVYNSIGIQDVYQEMEALSKAPGEYSGSVPTDTIHLLSSNSDYSSQQGSSIAAVYGDDMMMELARDASVAHAQTVESPLAFYRFDDNGEHVYEFRRDERTYEIAYVVAIRSIRAHHRASVVGTGDGTSFFMPMHDGRFVKDANGWSLVNNERMQVDDDTRMHSLETVDICTVMPFRTFDFAVNQNPPREVFDHPSDMFEEWEGLDSEAERSEFGVSGSVLKTPPLRPNAGVKSEQKLVRTKAIATAQVEVFSPDGGEYIFSCNDLFGEQVFSSTYDVEPGKWTRLGAVFTPQPGGLWWNEDYNYRVALKPVGPAPEGASVFVPYVDFDALVEAGVLQQDLKDLRLIYFNGVECREIDCDVTDNMELWFRLQGEVPAGDYTPGSYDYERETFLDGYYLYFGFDPAHGREESDPLRDYREVFHPYMCESNGTDTQDGWKISGDGEGFDFVDEYRIGEVGFITFEFTPDDDLYEIPEGETGNPDIRFLFDYDDGERQLQVYTFERQLTAVMREQDERGNWYESSFVSEYDENSPVFSSGEKSHVIVEWGAKGSADVYRGGVLDPNDKHRRKMTVWVDSPTPLTCINNVYDEQRYQQGVY